MDQKLLNESKNKTDLLAKTFESKAQLPEGSVDCPFFALSDSEFGDFVALRSR